MSPRGLRATSYLHFFFTGGGSAMNDNADEGVHLDEELESDEQTEYRISEELLLGRGQHKRL